MDLEARMQRLEAALETIQARLDQLAGRGSTKRAPGQAPDEAAREAYGARMKALSEQVREASVDLYGREKPLIMQVVLDRPGSTYTSMASMEELLERVDAAAIVKLAGVLASEVRLTILRALASGERSAAEVGAAAGLEGGPLYHHLSELQDGGFVSQPSRGRYAMTRRGRDLYFQVALLVRTPYDKAPPELGTAPPPEFR